MSANCRAHCRACHSHFSSDSAFDAHRIFEPGHNGDWDYRTCADLHELTDTKGRLRFGVKDEHGKCACASVVERAPVRVWALRAHLEAENPYTKARSNR